MNRVIDKKIIKSTALTTSAIFIVSLIEFSLIIPIAIALNISSGTPLSEIELALVNVLTMGDPSNFSLYITSSIICVLLGTIFSIFSQSIFQNYIWKSHNYLLNKLFTIYLKSQDWKIAKNELSRMKKNLASETQNIAVFYLGPICNIFGRIAFLLTLVFLIFYFTEIKVPMFSILTTVAIFIILMFAFYFSFKSAGRIREKAAEGIFSSIDEGLHNLPVMQILNKVDFFLSRMLIHSKRFLKITTIHAIIPQLPKYILEFIVFIFILLSVKFGEVTSSYSYVIVGFLKLAPTINILIKNFSDVGYGNSSLSILQNEFNKFKKASSLQKLLDINELKFDCHSNKKNISFKINRGEVLLIKGGSGSGKTTLLESLAGSEKNTYNIRLNNNPFEGFNSYKRVGFLPQDVFLINGTVIENITLDEKEPSSNDMSKIEHIIKKLKLDNLPMDRNFSTYGAGLSGGERQRIGIARCLYSNSELILMDEPTSALDGKNTLNIVEIITKLKKENKSLIIVTHSHKLDKIADNMIIL